MPKFWRSSPGPDVAEVTRERHRAPPTLDQHGAAIRAWLDQP